MISRRKVSIGRTALTRLLADLVKGLPLAEKVKPQKVKIKKVKAVKAAPKKVVRPARVFEVYEYKKQLPGKPWLPVWGWRCLMASTGKVLFTSEVVFVASAAALRSAEREAAIMGYGPDVVKLASEKLVRKGKRDAGTT